ncbi:hypothetical protein ACU16_10105 [Xanthomonas oryzae pv. oryzicola]|nr:hypothetical protein ACU16_10105 [Xanthomonas oryzae pv. oryzicola]AKO08332.1 hypothetical protein ACU17_09960 [Xanthomonas oryzae pv. oryzicola]
MTFCLSQMACHFRHVYLQGPIRPRVLSCTPAALGAGIELFHHRQIVKDAVGDPQDILEFLLVALAVVRLQTPSLEP